MARILVVEDDPAQRYLFVQLLRRLGYNAVSAASGDAALDLLAGATPIDAVLSDVSMPGMDGITLLKAVGRAYPGLPVVCMSVLSRWEWGLGTEADGIYFLQKPFERDALAQTLGRAIGRASRTSA